MTAHDSRKSQSALLLLGPALVGVAFICAEFSDQRFRVGYSIWNILDAASSSYATGLFLSILLENCISLERKNDSGSLEAIVAAVGLAFALSCVVQFLKIGSWRGLMEGLFVAAPSTGLLLPARTDRARALIFMVMAVAGLSRPLTYSLPPFVSMSIVCGGAAIYCLLRQRLNVRSVKARAIGQIASGTAVSTLCIYGLLVAYRRMSFSGILLFIIASAFFGGLTVLRIVLGDYWWVKSRS